MIHNETNKRLRVIIVHGWADDPSKGWIAWLTRELCNRGIEAIAPRMPEPKQPNIGAWIAEVTRVVGAIDEHTVLIGHSLGSYVLLRYLDGYPDLGKIGKLILVAGFAGHERANRGKTPLPEVDYGRIKSRVARIYNVYSDNDEVIPRERSEALGDDLGAENIVDPGKGHFAGLHGCDTLPIVLELI